jgi:chromosome condensin MukBEF MukE localization factor
MSDTIQYLRRQLAEAEDNLRLVQERKSEYVQITDIPIQLIKDERRISVKRKRRIWFSMAVSDKCPWHYKAESCVRFAPDWRRSGV